MHFIPINTFYQISPEQYLELERKAELKSELINGEMYAIARVEDLEKNSNLS